MEPNKIDAFFKNILEKKKDSVSENAWNRLEFMLDEEQSTKKPKGKRFYLIAASITIFTLIGSSYFSVSKKPLQQKNLVESSKIDTNSTIKSSTEIISIKEIGNSTKSKPKALKLNTNSKPILLDLAQIETTKETIISLPTSPTESSISKKKTITIEAEKLLALVENEISEEEKTYTIQNPRLDNQKLTREMLDSILIAELDFNLKTTGVQIDSKLLLAEIETEIDFDNSILDRGILDIIKKKIQKLTTAIASNDSN